MSSCGARVSGFVDQDDSQKKYSVWHLYGLLAVFLVAYGMLGKPSEKRLRQLWIGYILLAAILGFMEYLN